jgi:MFS transporter, AAHS family, 4-hydroxybenzoate transporter
MAGASPIDVPSWIDRQKVSPLQIAIACVCGAAVMLDGFDAQIIGFVAPTLIEEFKIAPAALATTFSAGLFGILAGCLVLAPLADWVGRRWIIIVSVAIFAVATLLTARIETLQELTILRFITGIGLGACMPNALALTSEYAPARLRGTLTAWMFTGFSLGALIGGLLAAQLIPYVGWRPLFVAGGVLPLVLVIIMIVFLPESVRHLTAKGAPSKRIAAILNRIHPDPSVTPTTPFLINEERRSGFTVAHLFNDGRAVGTITLWAMFFLMLLNLFLLASWTPTVLAAAGLPRETAVFIGAMQQAGSVIATIVLGPLFDRIGFYRSLVPLLVASAGGVLLMGAAGVALSVTVIAAMFAGAGVMGGQVAMAVLAGAFYPTYIRATGVGWCFGIGRVGAIVGPLVGGWMVANQWTPREIFMVAAVPPVVVALLLLFMRSHTNVSPSGSKAPIGAQ